MPYAAPNSPAVGDLITAAQGAIIAGDIAAGPNMGTPTSTAANGTVTSGTIETRDAVLGSYTFTAVAGRRYRAVMDGLKYIPTVAGDVYFLSIRNGGASTPTAASTAVASSQHYAPVIGTGHFVALSGTFVPGAGTVTLGLFVVRSSGTGTATPTSNIVNRELYAVDVGPA